MKKSGFLFLFVVSGALSHAQTIDFGIKAGLNLTEENHTASYAYDQTFPPGFNAGGVINISYKNFIIQPGAFFTEKGETGTYTLPPQVYFLAPGSSPPPGTESIKAAGITSKSR